VKINKAFIAATFISLVGIVTAIIGIAICPGAFPFLLIVIIGFGGCLYIFLDELICEIKACKRGTHGTPTKPTIAPMPKVPVPPKFKP
jgi:zinc transporter ZupT